MGMYARDFRARAKQTLHANYGLLLAGYLIFGLLIGASSAMIGIGLIVLGGPLTLGYAIYCLDASRGRALEIGRLFAGFNQFANALVLYITNGLLIFAWSLLLFIPGIIKTYSYSMSYYILADHPEMSANEARKESMRLMSGNKWRLFCLHLSFLGWAILSMFTLGILMIVYVGPYMQQANAEFYLNLIGEKN